MSAYHNEKSARPAKSATASATARHRGATGAPTAPAPAPASNTTAAPAPAPAAIPRANGAPPLPLPQAVSPWAQVEAAYLAHFHEPDLLAIKATYAAFAAHNLTRGQPVWVLVIGSPGSLKSALVESVDGLPNVHLIDAMTQHTFISGKIRDDEIMRADGSVVGSALGPNPALEPDPSSPSLLFRIGPSGKIAVSDFSVILSMNPNHRGSLFSQMRRIYDGHLGPQFGSGPSLNWRGRLTFLGAGTEDIDRKYAVFGSLGERFLLVRLPRSGQEAAQRAIDQDIPAVKREISAAAHLLLTDLEPAEPCLPLHIKARIPALGDFIACSRSHVGRNNSGTREINYVPDAEGATRISQQFAQLAKGSALLDRRTLVNEEDWQMVLRVAFDSLPPIRRRVLEALIQDGSDEGAVARTRCDDLPESTRRYAREELIARGVLDRSGSQLSPRSCQQLVDAGIL